MSERAPAQKKILLSAFPETLRRREEMIGKQKHLWQSRRFAKKTRDFRFAGLCALAPLREILYFFTRSELFRISGRQSRWPFTPLFHRSDGKFRFVF